MTVSELHAKLTELGFDVPIVVLTTVLKAGWDPAVPVPITSTWTKDKTEQVAWLCFLAARRVSTTLRHMIPEFTEV